MGRRRNEEERTRLYRTALSLFVRKGYNAARISEIADAAGVEKSTVQYYFPKKSLFISRLLEEMLDAVMLKCEKHNIRSERPFVMLYYAGIAHLDLLAHSEEMQKITPDILADRTLTDSLIATEIRWSQEHFPSAGDPDRLALGIRMTMGGLYEELWHEMEEEQSVDVWSLTESAMYVVTTLLGYSQEERTSIFAESNVSAEILAQVVEEVRKSIFS